MSKKFLVAPLKLNTYLPLILSANSSPKRRINPKNSPIVAKERQKFILDCCNKSNMILNNNPKHNEENSYYSTLKLKKRYLKLYSVIFISIR